MPKMIIKTNSVGGTHLEFVKSQEELDNEKLRNEVDNLKNKVNELTKLVTSKVGDKDE